MSSLWSGVRNFVSALRVQLDNVVNYFIDTHGVLLGAKEHLQEKAPNLPDLEAQRVIDYTVATREFGERINRLSPESRLNIGRAPVNPAYSGPPVYWTTVHWTNPSTGQKHEWLTIVNANPTETRRQAERRVTQLAIDRIKPTLPGGNGDDGDEPLVTKVVWLRGYRGV